MAEVQHIMEILAQRPKHFQRFRRFLRIIKFWWIAEFQARKEKTETWNFIWTGWKYNPSLGYAVGQWIAINRAGGPHLYVSYPGGSGPYLPGDELDTKPKEWQTVPDGYVSQEFLDQKHSQMYDQLLELIKTYTQDRAYRELLSKAKTA
jgi:hypothetical protein